jgi:hypothetical protein
MLCPEGIPFGADRTAGYPTRFRLMQDLLINVNGTANQTNPGPAQLSLTRPVVYPFAGLCFGEVSHHADSETVLLPLKDTLLVPT